MKPVCFALVLIFAVSGTFAFWKACPSGAPPTSVTSQNCTATVCDATKGQILIAQATIIATAAHTSLQSTFHAVILGLETQLGADDPDGALVCDQLQGARCAPGSPLTPGSSYIWNLRFSVPTNVPTLSNTQIRIRVRDGASLVSCAQVTANIKA